jgi:hypothetical protein
MTTSLNKQFVQLAMLFWPFIELISLFGGTSIPMKRKFRLPNKPLSSANIQREDAEL